MDATPNEIMEAVTTLRAEVESKSLDQDKIEKLNVVLDAHEDTNQALVTQDTELKSLRSDITEYAEKLEAAGKTDSEVKERMEQLEVELARVNQVHVDPANAFRETPEYKALHQMVVRGENAAWEDNELKASLRSDVATAGGYLATNEQDTVITKKITELDPIRSIARVRTIGAKALEMATRTGIPTAEYEGEAEEGTESISSYGLETITPFRQTVTIPITRDLLMDAGFNMESELIADAAEAFGYGEGNGFVVGTGHKRPMGFTADSRLTTGARVSTLSGGVEAVDVINLTGDLKTGYDLTYVMNRRTLASLRTKTTSAGDFLWQPGLNGPVASTLNGLPYVIANSMPDLATNAYSIALGDFRRGYTIVDRTGLSIIRDEITQKKKAIIEFTFQRWNTGKVNLPEAIKLLKIL